MIKLNNKLLATGLIHVLAWTIFIIMQLSAKSNQNIPEDYFRTIPDSGIFLITLDLMIAFYINFFYLIPKVLNKKGYKLYTIYTVILWLVYLLLLFVFISLGGLEITQKPFPLFVSLFPFILIIALSLSIRLLYEKFINDKIKNEREKEHLQSELSFLRSQISPHFLFNILNNVVSLSRKSPEKVEPTLIQLSNLIRYMLYTSDDKKVVLSKEIDYLENYIELQKLRFSSHLTFQFDQHYDENSIDKYQIEPMLLIPFIENAFKHGMLLSANNFIHLELGLISNTLTMRLKNSIVSNGFLVKDKDSGIGLKNVARRLILLYKDNHSLDIKESKNDFEVHFVLKLSKDNNSKI